MKGWETGGLELEKANTMTGEISLDGMILLFVIVANFLFPVAFLIFTFLTVKSVPKKDMWVKVRIHPYAFWGVV